MTFEDVAEPQYILLSDGKEAIIGNKFDYSNDWHHRYFPKCEYADSYRITGMITFGDAVILVNEELANINGASFFLFAHKGGISKNQIKLAKRLIRHKKDAVSIIVIWYTTPIVEIKPMPCNYQCIAKGAQSACMHAKP